MIRRDLGVKSALELDGATICVLPGTTTELNLTDWFRSKSLSFEPVVISELSQIQQAFFSGRCDVFTTDLSGLASTRQSADRPDDYVILPEAISKEPLGPAVRRDDWEFFTLVRWTLFGLIEAEEYGVTAANAREMRETTTSPAVQRLLGKSGEIGRGFGVESDWLVRAVEAVGNYGEMYERNIGPLGIPRGLNAQWKDGGLMYAPPVR
jgi:general L-amino acid transport system substrate-binding protein